MHVPLRLTKKLRIMPGFLPGALKAQGDAVFVGDEDTCVLRIDATTGGIVWKEPAERFEPADVAGDVLLTTNLVWTRARGLAAESGKVLYTIGATGTKTIGTYAVFLWRGRWLLLEEGSASVASLETGAILERRKPLPYLPKDGMGRIEGDVILYQAESDTLVVGYDLEREELSWKRPLRQEIEKRCGRATPTLVMMPIGPDVFLAIVQGYVLGCAVADGAILWHAPAPFDSPVVAADGRVYMMLIPSQESPRLICLSAATGETIYEAHQPELDVMDLPSQGVIHDEHVAFGTRRGLVGLFKLEDGSLAWSYRHEEQVTTPTLASDRLYARARDGNLLIFEAA